MVKTLPSNAGGAGLIPGQGAKIPHPLQPNNQNIKQKQYCNKFHKDFKNGPREKKENPLKKKPGLCVKGLLNINSGLQSGPKDPLSWKLFR